MPTTHPKNPISNTKTIAIFIPTIMLGYALFILPDLFFGITKINGGKIGINLLFIALFQFFTVTALLYASLRLLKLDFSFIGVKRMNIKNDIALGLSFGLLWTILQFAFIIPATGGMNRPDITGMLEMYDGSVVGTLSFIALGVMGGGITEELFNRGYFINVLKGVFKNPRTGLWVSAALSVVVFSLGHLPASALDWFDILVPTLMYTLLFITTRRLTASVVAHGIYNLTAILLTFFIYFK